MTASPDRTPAARSLQIPPPPILCFPFFPHASPPSRPNTPARVNLTSRFSRAESLQDHSGSSVENLEFLDRRERASSWKASEGLLHATCVRSVICLSNSIPVTLIFYSSGIHLFRHSSLLPLLAHPVFDNLNLALDQHV